MARWSRCLLVAAAFAAFFAAQRPAPALGSRDHPGVSQDADAEDSVRWRAIDVRASLDRDGALRVIERVTLAVSGQDGVAEFIFRRWVTATIGSVQVSRIDGSTGITRPLAPGDPGSGGRFHFDGDSWLRWNVRAPGDPARFPANTILAYQVDYVVSGSVIPIWGVRGFGSSAVLSAFPVLHPLRRASELWQAWRLAPGGLTGRYLLDFDFSPFAVNSGGPLDRFSLDLRLDPAWRPLALPRPLRTEIPAGEDLRDLLPLEFSGPGGPAGVRRALHAFWLLPLILGPGGVIALVAFRVARVRSQKRRLDGVPVDEAWITRQLLNRSPGAVRSLMSGPPGRRPQFQGAAGVLEEMEGEGTLALDGSPGTGRLVLRANRRELRPAERAFVDALFGATDTLTAHQARQRVVADPHGLKTAAQGVFAAAHPAGSPLAVRAQKAVSPSLIGLGVVLTLSVLEAGGFFALATALVVGSVVSQIGGLGLPSFARSGDLPMSRLALLALPAILFPAAMTGFFLMAPAHPLAIVGQGLLWLGLTNAMVNSTRSGWTEQEVELRYQLSRARQYIAAELEKKRPALDDEWLPWILALGLNDEVETWRKGKGMFATRVPAPGETPPGVRWTGGTEGAFVSKGWAQQFLYASEVGG